MIKDCDGAEIPKEDWPAAEELVREGYIQLCCAHGPQKMWKRGILKPS